MLRRYFFVILLCFIGVSVVKSQVYEQKSLLTVRSISSVQATPDIVIISLRITGLISKGGTLGVDILNRPLSYETQFKFGIVSTYDVKFFLESLLRKDGSYRVDKEIAVTLYDVSKLKDLFKEIVKLDYVEITGLSYRTTKLSDYREQARLKALKQAKHKATAMAESVGQSIGKVFSITENPADLIEIYSDTCRTASCNKHLISDDYVYWPSEINVTADLTVSFELK